MITIYSTETGEISRNIECPESMQNLQLSEKEAFLKGFGDSRVSYVDLEDPNKFTDKPVMDIIETGFTLHNIPAPATAIIDNVAYEITENILEIVFDTPGTHRIVFRKFPYLEMVITFET